MGPVRIPEFYADQNIFITGANGFMGKILVEKLLRSCPDLRKIYILMRGKRNKSATERWRQVTESMCFDRLKSERPGILESKVEIVEGEIKEKKLGLSEESYEFLQENITVVFHIAASVKFNDPLPDAVFTNLRGTHEVVKLALGMKNIKVFAQVSTTYCNCIKTESEEIIYPAPADWKKTIEITEKLDKRNVAILSQKYLGPYPNTYTFTKNLAEHIIQDYEDRLPVVILRPSVVTASVKEPIPGWIDTVNGPYGLLVAAAKGVIRIGHCDEEVIPDFMPADVAIKAIIVAAWKRAQRMKTKYYIQAPIDTVNGPNGLLIAAAKGVIRVGHCDEEVIPDFMPADVAIKAMIVAAWKRAQSKSNIEVPIYNMASTSKNVKNCEMFEMGFKLYTEIPLVEVIWAPASRSTKCKTWYRINAIFLHLLTSVFVDSALKILGKKPLLLKIQIQIHNAMIALGYFTTKQWTFNNKNFLSLNYDVPQMDKADFDYDFEDIEPIEIFRQGMMVLRKTFLKEDESDIPRAKIIARRMYWLDVTVKSIAKLLLVWAACSYFF